MEDFLDDWPGIVVTVSHDRAFLDRVTDELLALDGSGGVRWIRGGVAAWLAQRAAADAAPMPQMSARAPASTREKPRSGRSPSTVRRDLARAEAKLASANAARDQLDKEMASTNAHWELSTLGEQLAAAQAKVAAAEEAWLALAAEAEALGITP